MKISHGQNISIVGHLVEPSKSIENPMGSLEVSTYILKPSATANSIIPVIFYSLLRPLFLSSMIRTNSRILQSRVLQWITVEIDFVNSAKLCGTRGKTGKRRTQQVETISLSLTWSSRGMFFARFLVSVLKGLLNQSGENCSYNYIIPINFSWLSLLTP